MTTAYTSLLGLALPVTGELSGTWGDTVNDYITQYLDASVAGTQTISGSQTAVTLSKTTNASLSQAGSGATGSSQYNVINCTGNPASMLTVTVPAASKTYVVVNATSTNQDVKIVGAGPTTGVTLVAGERAIIAWNGSDFIKVATSTADGVTTLSFGSTGLTPSTATSGAVTVAGTLVAANGGTGQSTYTMGDLLYATGSTALSKLGIGTNGQVLTSTGTAPQWSTLSGVAVTTFSAGTTGFTPSSATSGAITLAGTLATTNGGTGLTSFTANGVVYASSTSALATGSALTFDGTNIDLATVGAKVNFATTGSATRNYIGGSADGYSLEMVMQRGASQPLSYKQDFAVGHAWSIAGSGAMTLTSTGLGIGTTSPSYKLNVVGANGGTTNLFQVGINAVTNGFSINTDASNNIVYSFLTKTGAAGIYQDASGNVGIGTTSPNEKLVVSGGCLQVTGSLQSLNRPSSSVVDFLSGATRFFSIGANSSTYGSYSFRVATTTANTEVMAIDSSGNLGLGVTPSAWSSAFKALQVSNTIIANNGAADSFFGSNYFFDGTNNKYITSAHAAAYGQVDGAHLWYTAPSGTAGNAISFTQAMTLDASGNLGVGVTSMSYPLDVKLANNQFILAREASTNITNGFRIGGVNNEAKAVFSANSATGEVNLGAINTNYFLTFSTNGANERFRIASNGAWGLAGANYGTSGQVLTSNGSGSAPTWQNAGGSAATPTALGTVYGKTDLGSPYSSFLGYQAGNSTTASSNVGVGYQSLYTNSTGTGNAALGVYSLFSNTTGSYNTAVGSGVQGSVFGPLHNNTTGLYNIAVGTGALYANTTGSNNVAVGYQALYSGNSTLSNNVAVGYRALYSNGGSTTNGIGCIGIGTEALYNHTTSQGTIGIGYRAGYSMAGTADNYPNNIFIGANAGYSNTSGNQNIFIGSGWLGDAAGYSNTTGTANVAIGVGASKSNTTGTNNTSIGYYAFNANTSGTDDTALGRQALTSNTTGSNNTAIGRAALSANTTAPSNTAVGYFAGASLTTGGYNTIMGDSAGNYTVAMTTAAQCVILGYRAQPSAAGDGDSIVIGANATGKGSSTGFISPGGGGVYQGNNSSSWSTTSDFRLKKNIVDNNEGLEKITAIRVRNFEYRLPEEVTDLDPQCAINKTGVQLGVIAQELQQVCPDCVKEESTGVLSVDSDNVFWHMVNAIKQLNAKVEALQAEITTLKGA